MCARVLTWAGRVLPGVEGEFLHGGGPLSGFVISSTSQPKGGETGLIGLRGTTSKNSPNKQTAGYVGAYLMHCAKLSETYRDEKVKRTKI